MLEGLRDRATPNGVAAQVRLKVVGQDALPKGAVYGPAAVTLSAGMLDGWDLGGRALVVTGRASAVNILSRQVAGVRWLYPIEIAVTGDLEWAENLEMSGAFGGAQGPGVVMNARSAGTGAGFTAGKMRMLRRSRFEGFRADHLKLHGVAGATQVVEECYFGPQWATVGSRVHADVFTTVAGLGAIHIRRNLVDWTDAGRAAGLNNVFRIDRNTGTTWPLKQVRVEENLCFWGPGVAFPIQVSRDGAGFEGPVEFVNNWLGAKVVARNGSRHWYHPSTNGAVALWAGNRDSVTDAVVPAPLGAAGG